MKGYTEVSLSLKPLILRTLNFIVMITALSLSLWTLFLLADSCKVSLLIGESKEIKVSNPPRGTVGPGTLVDKARRIQILQSRLCLGDFCFRGSACKHVDDRYPDP